MIEEWRIIPDWPNYKVSNLGTVKRLSYTTSDGKYLKERILKQGRWIDQRGHVRLFVTLGSIDNHVNRTIGRLVLLSFCGPPKDGQECRHLDDNPDNCSLENLVWGTHYENIQDSMRNGRMPKGVKSGMAKLTEEKVLLIRRMHRQGSHEYGAAALGRLFGVAGPTIQGIIKRKYWKHV